MPWHVMRNGTNLAFSEGEADEIALYTQALTRTRWPPTTRSAAGWPPFRRRPTQRRPRRSRPPPEREQAGAFSTLPPRRSRRLRRGSVSGAVGESRRARRPRHREPPLARRRGARWRVSDAAAALRAGSGCRQLQPRVVSCRAALVKRIVMYGGVGDDRLTVIGRVPSRLVGGPGRDRYTKKRPSR